jgi:hypothetical protein
LPKISLNSFIDYFVAQTASKPARVRATKTMMTASSNYAAMDYWLPLRKATEEAFVAGGDKTVLDAALSSLTDYKKQHNYSDCVSHLKKWMGSKAISATTCSSQLWTSGGLEVRVTPELLMTLKGTTYVLKFWFKSDALSKNAANPMLRLMEHTHGKQGDPAILDVRRRKLITGAVPKPADMDLVLASEALAYADLWSKV